MDHDKVDYCGQVGPCFRVLDELDDRGNVLPLLHVHIELENRVSDLAIAIDKTGSMPLIIILDFGNESSAGLTFIYDMIILNLGNEDAAVIILVLSNKGTVGLTSI